MKRIYYLAVLLLALTACNNDDYLIDGGVSDPHVNMTTYDFLKSKTLFDTLVMAIDKAGLKEEVNRAATFYAPTNFSFKRYVDVQISYMVDNLHLVDPKFTFDSIAVETLRDSLQMYMFDRQLSRDSLDKEGTICASFIGKQMKVSNEPEKVYSEQLVDEVGYLYFINKKGKKFETYDETKGLNGHNKPNTAEADTRERIQTSGIISTTGIVHVLNNGHTLFFHNPAGK